MRLKRIGATAVDQCDTCAGIWLDSGELARLLGLKDVSSLEKPRAIDKRADEKRGSCPRCRGEGKLVQITSTTVPDGHIDTCPTCGGQWLDAGELAALRDEGGLRPLFKLMRKLLEA